MANPQIVAISGAKGFIGTRLVSTQHRDIQFLPIPVSLLSIEEARDSVMAARESGATKFLHLSWPAATFSGDYRTSVENFRALERTLVIKEECLKNQLPFFGIGSQVDQESNMKSLYSITKTIARGVFDRSIRNHEIAWLRPYFVFEENRWPSFLVKQTGRPIEIQDDTPRDFVHVQDVVSGIHKVLSHELMGQIDLGSGVLRRPSELCSALGVPCTTKPEAERFPRTSFQPASLDQRLAKVWQPTHTNRVFRGDFEQK